MISDEEIDSYLSQYHYYKINAIATVKILTWPADSIFCVDNRYANYTCMNYTATMLPPNTPFILDWILIQIIDQLIIFVLKTNAHVESLTFKQIYRHISHVLGYFLSSFFKTRQKSESFILFLFCIYFYSIDFKGNLF